MIFTHTFNVKIFIENGFPIEDIKPSHALLISTIAHIIENNLCEIRTVNNSKLYNISPDIIKKYCVFFNNTTNRQIRNYLFDLEDLKLIIQSADNKKHKSMYFKVHSAIKKIGLYERKNKKSNN